MSSLRRPAHPVRMVVELVVALVVSAALTAVVVTSVLNVNTSSSRGYHAIFADASGLQAGDDVRIAGVEAGKVDAVRLTGGARSAEVDFDVDAGQPVYATTRAVVRYADLLGTRYLALIPAAASGTQLTSARQTQLPPGATIPESRTAPALDLTAVFNGFQPLFDALTPTEVNQLTGSIIDIFQGQSQTIASLVGQIAGITTNLADRQQIVDEVVTNLARLLDSVSSQDKNLGQVVTNFSKVVSNLAGQRQTLAATITGLSTLTNHVSKLTGEAEPAINADITGLSQAASTLAANQQGLNGVLQGLPGTLNTLSKVASSGSYLGIYVCNLTIKVTGQLNLSLVPGLAAPQYPQNLQLPSGPAGDQSQHTRVCAGKGASS